METETAARGAFLETVKEATREAVTETEMAAREVFPAVMETETAAREAFPAAMETETAVREAFPETGREATREAVTETEMAAREVFPAVMETETAAREALAETAMETETAVREAFPAAVKEATRDAEAETAGGESEETETMAAAPLDPEIPSLPLIPFRQSLPAPVRPTRMLTRTTAMISVTGRKTARRKLQRQVREHLSCLSQRRRRQR